MKSKKCGKCGEQGHSIRTCKMMIVPSRTRRDHIEKAARNKETGREA